MLLTPDRDGDGIGDALEGVPETDYVVTIYTSDMRCVMDGGPGFSQAAGRWLPGCCCWGVGSNPDPNLSGGCDCARTCEECRAC